MHWMMMTPFLRDLRLGEAFGLQFSRQSDGVQNRIFFAINEKPLLGRMTNWPSALGEDQIKEIERQLRVLNDPRDVVRDVVRYNTHSGVLVSCDDVSRKRSNCVQHQKLSKVHQVNVYI